MTPALFLEIGIVPALSLLPDAMDTPEARALLLTIALQESQCKYRRQVNGPARSFLQFERAGIIGVLNHRASARHSKTVCDVLEIEWHRDAVYTAIEFQDVLACALGRLLLWTDPTPLPQEGEVDLAFNAYLSTWRPGTPRPGTWPDHFSRAWAIVREGHQ